MSYSVFKEINRSSKIKLIVFQLNELSRFIQSTKNQDILFSNKDNLSFRNLAIGSFSVKNEEHLNLLNSVLNNFQLDLRNMQAIDIKLVLTISFGLISLALVPVSMGFTSILTAAAFTYIGYLFKAREAAYDEYSTTLQHMTNIYIWAMNDSDSQITNNPQLEFNAKQQLHPKIKVMHELVNPMLSDQNTHNYTCEIFDKVLNMNPNDSTSILNKNYLSSSYLFYGQHQASKFKISQGLLEIARRSTVDKIYNTARFFSFSQKGNTSGTNPINFNDETCTA